MLRGRPSSLEGDDASLARPACRPALDPGDLYGPWGRWCGQARACPGDRRGTPITTYRQDQKAQNYMIEISTVSGDCQDRLRGMDPLAGVWQVCWQWSADDVGGRLLGWGG